MALTLSKSRIEALSDGVFSIAMTLLVLKLEVPEVMHHDSDMAMLHQLLALKTSFLTYVATFLIAGRFWYLHHLTFHFIRHVDGFLLGVNLFFLMFVSLLPFSSGLMSHLFVHPVSQLFYFGNQLAIALLLNLHWRYARSKGLATNDDLAEANRLTSRLRMIAILFIACLATSTVLPAYSWVPFPALWGGAWIAGRFRRRKKH